MCNARRIQSHDKLWNSIWKSLPDIAEWGHDIVQEKELIVRTLGNEDRRQMYFHLSPAGKQRVNELELDKVEIPELLKPLF